QHRGARPRLRGGFRGRDRRQFHHDRQRQYRRSAGHRGKNAVQPGPASRAARSRPQGHRQAGRSAEDGGYVGMAHRPIAGRLVIATHNPGKLAEMRELLAVYGVDAISAGELKLAEPEETGTTFRENARIKAQAAATASKLPAFADDSGLTVDALDGQPGMYSARWAGPDKDFRAAMNKIQSLLIEQGAKSAERRRGH